MTQLPIRFQETRFSRSEAKGAPSHIFWMTPAPDGEDRRTRALAPHVWKREGSLELSHEVGSSQFWNRRARKKYQRLKKSMAAGR